MGLTRLGWDALGDDSKLDTILLSFLVSLLVSLNTVKEVILALRWENVLSADVDALWSDVVVNTALDQNTNGTWRNVPDDAGCAVVKTVRHARVDSTIDMNVNDVTNAESPKAKRWIWHSVLAELAGEEITGSVAKAFGVSHDKGRPNRTKSNTLVQTYYPLLLNFTLY